MNVSGTMTPTTGWEESPRRHFYKLDRKTVDAASCLYPQVYRWQAMSTEEEIDDKTTRLSASAGANINVRITAREKDFGQHVG